SVLPVLFEVFRRLRDAQPTMAGALLRARKRSACNRPLKPRRSLGHLIGMGLAGEQHQLLLILAIGAHLAFVPTIKTAGTAWLCSSCFLPLLAA
ncbi:MAG: hypothetical protein VKM17_01195, partial [Cyanobacteriota bacterium]|nr:hypothetical protein [Cyanobacteriota bacterium]